MNTPSVYISAALLEVEYAAAIRDELAKLGVPCTSTWINEAIARDERVDPMSDSARANILAKNREDIERANCCAFLAHVGAPRAAHWDCAYALLARSKPLFWVSSSRGRNVWDCAPGVIRLTEGISARQTAVKLENAIRKHFCVTGRRTA